MREASPISLRLRLDFSGLHGKLVGHMFSREAVRYGSLSPPFLATASSRRHAVHMSARLNESYPISLRPLGLTSWTFIVSYTHERPLRGHGAPPLQKPRRSVCAFGLTSRGFMVNLIEAL